MSLKQNQRKHLKRKNQVKNKIVNDVIKEYQGFSVKTKGKTLTCSLCDHVQDNRYNTKASDYIFCDNCLSINKVITAKRTERIELIYGSEYISGWYNFDIGYDMNNPITVLEHQESADGVYDTSYYTHVRGIYTNMGGYFYYQPGSDWRKIRPFTYIKNYLSEGGVHVIKGNKCFREWEDYYLPKADLNYMYTNSLLTINVDDLRKVNYKKLKTLNDLENSFKTKEQNHRWFNNRYYQNYLEDKEHPYILDIIKDKKLDEYIDVKTLLKYPGLENFNGDRFELEKLINETNNYYVQMYIDEGYSILKFNKHDRRWLLSIDKNLNEEELEAFYNVKKQDMNAIKRYISMNENFRSMSKLNDILIKYDNSFGEYKGLHFSLPITPYDLDHEGNILRHCVGGYKNKIDSEDRIIFFVRYKENRPYATVEYDTKRRSIYQARTYYNKNVSKKVRNIINDFINERLIIVDAKDKKVSV